MSLAPVGPPYGRRLSAIPEDAEHVSTNPPYNYSPEIMQMPPGSIRVARSVGSRALRDPIVQDSLTRRYLRYANFFGVQVFYYVTAFVWANWVDQFGAPWLAARLGSGAPAAPGAEVGARAAAAMLETLALWALFALYTLLASYPVEEYDRRHPSRPEAPPEMHNDAQRDSWAWARGYGSYEALLQAAVTADVCAFLANDRRDIRVTPRVGFWALAPRFLRERLWIINLYSLQLVFNLTWAFVLANDVVPWIAVSWDTDATQPLGAWYLVAAEVIISVVLLTLLVAVDTLRLLCHRWESAATPHRPLRAALSHDVRFALDSGFNFVWGFLWGTPLSFGAVRWIAGVWFGQAGAYPPVPSLVTQLAATAVAAVAVAAVRVAVPNSQPDNGPDAGRNPTKWRWRRARVLIEMVRFGFAFITSYALAMWVTFGLMPTLARAVGLNAAPPDQDCAVPAGLYPVASPEDLGRAAGAVALVMLATFAAHVAFERLAPNTNMYFPVGYAWDVVVPRVPRGFSPIHYPLVWSTAFAIAWTVSTDFQVAIGENAVGFFTSSCPFAPQQHAEGAAAALGIGVAIMAGLYPFHFLYSELIYDRAARRCRAALDWLADAWDADLFAPGKRDVDVDVDGDGDGDGDAKKTPYQPLSSGGGGGHSGGRPVFRFSGPAAGGGRRAAGGSGP